MGNPRGTVFVGAQCFRSDDDCLFVLVLVLVAFNCCLLLGLLPAGGYSVLRRFR